MKVSYVTMQFPTSYETFAVNDLMTLRRLGVDLSVHSLRPEYPDSEVLGAEYGLSGIPVSHNSLAASLAGIGVAVRRPGAALALISWVVARTWRNPDHLVRSLILVPRVLQLVETIRGERPDLVHLFWGHYPAMVGHLVRREMPGTVLSVFLGAYDLTWNYGGTAPVARDADVVWTHARENIPAILRLGVPAERVAVSYRGVDLRSFAPTDAAAEPRKIWRRIVSVSRLIPAKAADEVLHVFARVREEWPDATLVLLGDGPERARLEALATSLGIRGAVDFRGHVSREVVREELAAAEVFLLMSRNESERLPNVVKEAMCSRCLCIVTESPGIGELLEDGVHGFVVAHGEIATAARRVGEVFRGEVAVEEMVSAASERIRTHFDVERNMGLYLERWSELLAAGESPVLAGGS